MRNFKDGQELVLENPWRAQGVSGMIKDLVWWTGVPVRPYSFLPAVMSRFRPAMHRRTGIRLRIPVSKEDIWTGQWTRRPALHVGHCVRAACPNASAAHLHRRKRLRTLGILPQGKPELDIRAIRMVAQMNAEGFGGCTNIGECTAVCPKEIPLSRVIAAMNHRDYPAKAEAGRRRDNHSNHDPAVYRNGAARGVS